ncbi:MULTISPECIES: Rha family transcriptional regulator [Streptococcus]|uniref:PRha family phage regulatory protein n=1 Tax=Streptococcus dysgalactiae TaxID=1334 RepID=A0A9X9SHR7_STRDY|nr:MULTISPECIES: Rha family transcriptional regulator [Streptococcus]VTS18277.1 pRha family phage regulatory protein [Streptococcus dysgalactiae subsp. equisimilis]VTS46475.1 pRha family phage regulatory protein [Streptococcus dysgalactiae subsp. equisimilis]VTS49967.1 pRha family phage regulatory protein [Streptococcus dysgalactiae subsp. equisimilis]VTS77434.1 pRha family phage regulatory protein [Streptococcus dysgalactiae]VTS78148.1 pRha family phage regulatory protein [Streptococcus dysga
MNLVYLDGKKEPYTTSEIIAECAGVKHHAVQEHIRKNKERLERLGKVSFQMRPLPSGQQAKDYILNEQQATLLITFLKNTEQVATFKENLVKAFFAMREELTQIRLQRSLEAPKRKTLNEAIKTWEHAPKMAYPTVYNLLLKAVTGKNSKQLKASRGGYSGIDCLNSIELAQYTALEDMAIALINLNFTYQDIKTMALKNTLQCA